MLGQNAEARAAIADLVRIVPGITLASYARETSFRAKPHHTNLLAALEKAGLPDGSPARDRQAWDDHLA